MARYTDAKCKRCRREGMKLFLKGERCFSSKCALEKRSFPPGMHGQKFRRRLSDYGLRLREKQKVKTMYGVLERQFRRYFDIASRKSGATGENLLRILERRLDNVVYRAGFAPSRNSARQFILHGAISLNGKKTDIPSLLVKVGDIIEVREKYKSNIVIRDAMAQQVRRSSSPAWMDVNPDSLIVKIVDFPSVDELPKNIQEQLIVELYSR